MVATKINHWATQPEAPEAVVDSTHSWQAGRYTVSIKPWKIDRWMIRIVCPEFTQTTWGVPSRADARQFAERQLADILRQHDVSS